MMLYQDNGLPFEDGSETSGSEDFSNQMIDWDLVVWEYTTNSGQSVLVADCHLLQHEFPQGNAAGKRKIPTQTQIWKSLTCA